jgi:hypothetical protein
MILYQQSTLPSKDYIIPSEIERITFLKKMSMQKETDYCFEEGQILLVQDTIISD